MNTKTSAPNKSPSNKRETSPKPNQNGFNHDLSIPTRTLILGASNELQQLLPEDTAPDAASLHSSGRRVTTTNKSSKAVVTTKSTSQASAADSREEDVLVMEKTLFEHGDNEYFAYIGSQFDGQLRETGIVDIRGFENECDKTLIRGE